MDDDSLHSLLSRGRMSGAQRERALEGALRRSGGGARRWAAVAAAALVPLAAGLFLFVWAPEGPDAEPAVTRTLVAKGFGTPQLRASCLGRPAGECRAGDRLIFEIEGAEARGYFAAYAECGSAERIWYFPTARGELPEIDDREPRTVIDRAAHIGAEHGVGFCALHLFALERPETRQHLVAGELAGAIRAEVTLEVKSGGEGDAER